MDNQPSVAPNTITHVDVLSSLKTALSTLRAAKPEDRSGIDRRYMLTINKLEDVFAYFYTYVYIKVQEANKE